MWSKTHHLCTNAQCITSACLGLLEKTDTSTADHEAAALKKRKKKVDSCYLAVKGFSQPNTAQAFTGTQPHIHCLKVDTPRNIPSTARQWGNNKKHTHAHTHTRKKKCAGVQQQHLCRHKYWAVRGTWWSAAAAAAATQWREMKASAAALVLQHIISPHDGHELLAFFNEISQ